jgi:hypothetical protein
MMRCWRNQRCRRMVLCIYEIIEENRPWPIRMLEYVVPLALTMLGSYV